MTESLSFKISGKKIITTELPAFIVGILNVTPDSFCPVGKCSTETVAQKALKLIEEGADMIDLGAESTRPGSVPVSEEEELRRLIPALKEIRKVTDCPISIDTTKAAVMKAAIEEGADILNDVSALSHDSQMINVCSEAEIPVILMDNHDIMNLHGDASEFVAEHLAESVMHAVNGGVNPERMILDAGIGFGKTFGQNLQLIRNSRKIRQLVLEKTKLADTGLLPVMMALSRKSCIGKITGREVDDRLSGTIAANLVAVQEGAAFLRVHDVAETRDMLETLKALM